MTISLLIPSIAWLLLAALPMHGLEINGQRAINKLTLVYNKSTSGDVVPGGIDTLSREHSAVLTFTKNDGSEVGVWNISTGQFAWKKRVDYRGPFGTWFIPLGNLAIHVFYQGGEDRSILEEHMTAFDILTGTQKWYVRNLNNTLPIAEGYTSYVHGDVAYVLSRGERTASDYNYFSKINLTTGFLMSCDRIQGGAMDGSKVYLANVSVSDNTTQYMALDMTTGSMLWSVHHNYDWLHYPSVFGATGGKYFVVMIAKATGYRPPTGKRTIICLNQSTGDIIHSENIDHPDDRNGLDLNFRAMVKNYIAFIMTNYSSMGQSHYYVYDFTNGRLVKTWRAYLNWRRTSGVIGDYIFFTYSNNEVTVAHFGDNDDFSMANVSIAGGQGIFGFGYQPQDGYKCNLFATAAQYSAPYSVYDPRGFSGSTNITAIFEGKQTWSPYASSFEYAAGKYILRNAGYFLSLEASYGY